MTHLDLFSGIGGFALSAKWCGFETIQFVEINKFCQKVLAKNSPGIDIHDDIKTFKATKFRGVGLITGGFPCAPVSHAGKRGFKEDDRWLWPEMFRVIREANPRWVLIENVIGFLTMGIDDVLYDLESRAGYECQAFVIPALAVDARHRRNRVFIVANSDTRLDQGTKEKLFTRRDTVDESSNVVPHADVADRASSRNDARMGGISEQIENSGNEGFRQWSDFTDVRRVAYGFPDRLDRLRGLGQSVVPQVAYEIMRNMT